jgi:N-acetylglutamate synthase-like GNAT family acetyltransferase
VSVRRAAPDDSVGIALLLGQLGYPVEPERVRARLDRLDAEPWVAVAGDEIIGLAAVQMMHVLQRDAPVARLTALVVRDDARRRGVARRLLEVVESRARDAGCEHLHVTSAERRADAHEAYRALGLSDTGRRFGKALR